MRNIAVFGDCAVQGITINQYQVRQPSTAPATEVGILLLSFGPTHPRLFSNDCCTLPRIFLSTRASYMLPRPLCPQVNVGNKYNSEAGLSDSCVSRQGDFQSLPFEDGEFDAAYQIEATCHSPDKVMNRRVCLSCSFSARDTRAILHVVFLRCTGLGSVAT